MNLCITIMDATCAGRNGNHDDRHGRVSAFYMGHSA